MRNFKSASAHALLYSSILASGLLLVNGAAVTTAYAAACTGAVDTLNSTTCVAGATAATLTYVLSNPTYAGGPFTLELQNHDVTGATNGITFSGVSGTNTINLLGDSDVSGAAGDGINLIEDVSNVVISIQDTSSVTGSVDGIDAETTFSGSISITTGANTTVTGTTGDGIQANTSSGSIVINTGGNVSGAGDGIEADVTFSGNVNITTAAGSTVSGTAGDGINANSVSSVTITANSIVTGGGDGIEADANSSFGSATVTTGPGAVTGNFDGVDAQANGSFGTVTVTTGDGAVTGTIADGIEAEANGAFGSASVTTGLGAITGGGDGIDIEANGSSGSATVITGAGAVTGGDNGIEADANGFSGSVTVTTGSGAVTGIANDGIQANANGSSGSVSVTTGAGAVTGNTDGIDVDANGFSGFASVNTGAGAVTGTGDNGIEADVNGSSGSISITTGAGAVTGNGTNGIEANANGFSGSINITTGAGAISGAVGDGIQANANGSSGFASVTTGTGAVSGNAEGIDAHADGFSGFASVIAGDGAVTGTTGDGIEASANGTFGSVSVTTGAGAISGGDDGVDAEANGSSGFASVTTGTGAVTGADDGIDIEANGTFGNLTVTTGTGTVTGTNDAGIEANATGTFGGTVSITTNGTVQGFDTGIDATTGSSGFITINNNTSGNIQNLSGLDTDLAIRITGGPSSINNEATINGRIDTSAFSDTLNNNSSGSWFTDGISNFGLGTDSINNNAGGTIIAGNDAGVANTTSFVGLEFLNNGGNITLSDQSSGDGSNISDLLVTDGDYSGSGGNLTVDAFLGGAGSLSDVMRVGGNTSGTTVISVNNTNPNPGVLGPTQILVVDVVGDADEGHFALEHGVVNTGVIIYELVFNDTDQPNDQFLLVSAVNELLFEPTATVAGAQEIWRETAAAWETRQTALRDRLARGVVVTAVADPAIPEAVAENGLWIAGLGSWTERDDETSFSGFDFELKYEQEIYGVIGGADFGTDLGNGGTLLFGALAGYVESELDFGNSQTSIDYEGATGGLYASWMGGGFFANVLVKADLLDMNYNEPSPSNDSDDAEVVSYGARGDVGFRFGGDTLFIEPMVSVDAIVTEIDEFTIGGADFDPGTNESYRGGAGLRAGFGGEMVRLSALGRVWEVFSTDNEVDISPVGPALEISDDGLEGTYGEVAGQVDIDLSTRAMLFVRGSVLFSDDITKPAVHGGFNFTW